MQVPLPEGPAALTAWLKNQARALGFTAAGACRADRPPGVERLAAWLQAGFAGEMAYLPARAAAYEHPRHVLSGARSLLVVAAQYLTSEARAVPPGFGRVSRYAWGRDYHGWMRERLHRLADALREVRPGARTRGIVDTAPLLEREFAQLAGLGWIGKHTLLLNRTFGSWFFLGVLLTDQELAADSDPVTDHCGTCRACLDACPTQAFPEPYVLDARRCISYLTIELQGLPPVELRDQLHGWAFGCDVCQDVCPWNRRAPGSVEPDFQPRSTQNPLDLIVLFSLTEADFRRQFADTPLWRARRRGLLRNAALILGTQRLDQAAPALQSGLYDAEPLVRAACAWALGRLQTPQAAAALTARLACEEDGGVRAEVAAALQFAAPPSAGGSR